jgi:hypothetical protein
MGAISSSWGRCEHTGRLASSGCTGDCRHRQKVKGEFVDGSHQQQLGEVRAYWEASQQRLHRCV